MRSEELELDVEERRLLREGYAALHPPSGKQDFILGALSVRLPGALGPGGAEPVGSGAGAPRGELARGGLGGARAAQLIGSGLVIGALGFGLGSFVSRQESTGTLERGPAVAAPSNAQDLGTSPVPDGFTLSELDAEPVAASGSEPAERGAASRAKAPEPGPGQTEPAQVSFYEELSYIRRAQTALSGGNPALALGLMRSLRELRPDGALLAERGVTEVLALCALGRDGEAKGVADAVRGRGDGAMYVARLEKTCAPGAVPDDSGDDAGHPPTSTEQTSGRQE